MPPGGPSGPAAGSSGKIEGCPLPTPQVFLHVRPADVLYTHTHVMGVCKINRAWIQQNPPPDKAHAGSPLLYGDPPVSQGEEGLSFHIAQPLRRCRTLVTLKAPAALLPALHKQAGAYRRAWSVLAAEQLQRCRATPGNDIKPFQGFPGRESRDVLH